METPVARRLGGGRMWPSCLFTNGAANSVGVKITSTHLGYRKGRGQESGCPFNSSEQVPKKLNGVTVVRVQTTGKEGEVGKVLEGDI